MLIYTHFAAKYGKVMGPIRLFLYPLSLFLTMPVALAKTLWNCRVLAEGKWEEYGPQFNNTYAINNLWYPSIAINFLRHGRNGISPNMGLGKYTLSMLYTFNLPSLYALKYMRCMVPFIGMFIWLMAHFIWNAQVGGGWLFLVIGLTLISSSFYLNIFGRQNYHTLGWMFVPIALYAVQTGQWWLAAAAWLGMSFGSAMATIMMSFAIAFLSAWTMDPMPVLSIVPAGLKLFTHLIPSIREKGLHDTLEPMIKVMGGIHKNTKYARKEKGTLLQIPKGELIYFILIYGQFLIATWLLTGEFSPLLFAGILIFIANSTILRLHDIQTVYMMLMSIGTMTILSHPDPALVPFYWLLISPIPYFLNMPDNSRVLDVMPVCGPVRIAPEVEKMEDYFSEVSKGSNVLMCFNDPEGLYSNVFDGYRMNIELFLYVAAQKGINLMPDWFSIFEANYDGAPDFWGRDIESVSENVKKWDVSHLVYYQDKNTPLGPEWMEAGYKIVKKFSWYDHPTLNKGWLILKPAMDWWLIEVPSDIQNNRPS